MIQPALLPKLKKLGKGKTVKNFACLLHHLFTY